MKNPNQKQQGLAKRGTLEEYEKKLTAALGPIRWGPLDSRDYRKWLQGFVENAPCLKTLYCDYGVDPREIIETVAICRFSPVPPQFPAILRNGRKRKTLAGKFEKLAAIVYKLDSLNTPLYGNLKLFSDRTLDLQLREAAEKIRQQKSLEGRPENVMVRECACYLRDLFRQHASLTLQTSYLHINQILRAAFPDLWSPRGGATDKNEAAVSAVKDLLTASGPAPTKPHTIARRRTIS